MTATALPLAAFRRLIANTGLNLAGQVITLVASLVALPYIVSGLGTEAFGAFQLVWVVLGYFALVDLGIGRATTRFVADALGRGAPDEVPGIVGTAVTVQLLTGLAGSLIVVLAAPAVVTAIVHPSAELIGPTRTSLRLLALALPAVLIAASFSGVLEAHQRFDLVNAVRVPAGLLTVLAPVAVLAAGGRLVAVVAVAVIVRIATALAFALVCRGAVPVMRRSVQPRRELLKPMLSFGGWIAVSSVVSPLMMYLDRFVVGGLLGLNAVAYYTAPYDGVTRAAVVPSSLASTLFPAFSSLGAGTSREQLRPLYGRAVRLMFLLMLPISLAIIVLAHPALTLWLGPAFAEQSTTPLRILAAAVLVNAVAQVPYALLQGIGRADLVAKFHLVELPLYGIMLWLLTKQLGIAGTALAWALRATLDAVLLFTAAARVTRR